MKVYLDSWCLVHLLDGKIPGITPGIFEAWLRRHHAELVLSWPLVHELIDPLWHPGAVSDVFARMTYLEQVPHVWINNIYRIEQRELIRALTRTSGRPHPMPPIQIRGYVEAQVSPPEDLVGTNAPLGWLVGMLKIAHGHDPVASRRALVSEYRARMASHRAIASSLSTSLEKARRKLFVERTTERMLSEGLAPSEVLADRRLLAAVADHLYDTPADAPAKRIGFQLWHVIAGAVSDKLDDGDLYDMIHVAALPYVDAYVADRRMTGYLAQVCRKLGLADHQKLMKGVPGLLATHP